MAIPVPDNDQFSFQLSKAFAAVRDSQQRASDTIGGYGDWAG
jgi:hypothetical protein